MIRNGPALRRGLCSVGSSEGKRSDENLPLFIVGNQD